MVGTNDAVGDDPVNKNWEVSELPLRGRQNLECSFPPLLYTPWLLIS